jgi:hypothetical protein
MNNYKVTLHRVVEERYYHAVEAENAEQAVALAKEYALNSYPDFWEGDVVEASVDFEVEIAK